MMPLDATGEESAARQPGGRETAWLLGAIALARGLYAWAGVRFDASPLDWYWQYLDPAWLRTDLWRSVAHLHGQPPLFNLFLGLVLKLPVGLQTAAFAAVFVACGIASAWGLLALQARLGVRRAIRLPLAILFAVSPQAVLYENHLFYALPVTALLVVAAWLLAGTAGGRQWTLALALLAAVALTHSLFHLLWLGGAIGLLAWLAPGQRRRVALAACLPLALVALWYARSLWMFDTFSASSWLGLNLAHRMQLSSGGREAVETLSVDHPEVGILGVRAFSPLADYAGWAPDLAPTGCPVLDQSLKSTGAPNLEHLAYLTIARRSAAAAVTVWRAAPAVYIRGTGMAWRAFLRPAADSPWLQENGRRIRGWVLLWGRVIEGRWRPEPGRLGPAQISVVWMLVLPLALATGIGVVHGARRGREPVAGGIAAGFLVWTILYVAVVGNAVELGENDRFRFLLEPLLLALLGRWLSDRWRSLRPRPGS